VLVLVLGLLMSRVPVMLRGIQRRLESREAEVSVTGP
jgi:hypothetical protein